MSYLVLARKYRPKAFAEMVGQGHVVTALVNALSMRRLHHAYMFTGTRGVGKTTVSRILAKSLNCLGPDGTGGITASPCGVCRACRDIDDGRFADYTELDAASNRGVDEIQSLLEQSVYKPVLGRFKVFMIDEVHMLSNTAFNAMLKTLEEPPEYLKFVLATTDPQKVPPTVLSRCLQFSLRPIAPEVVSEHLGAVLAQENMRADPLALRLLARAARGSMRDALSLADQALAFGNGVIEEAAVRQMLGSAGQTVVFEMLKALAQSDGKRLLQHIEALAEEGLSPGSLLEEMVAQLQRMAFAQASGEVHEHERASASGTDPDDTVMLALARSMPPDETQLLYSICLHGRAELGLAPDEYAALSMILLRFLAFKGPAPREESRPEGQSTAAEESPTRAANPSRVMLGVKIRQEHEARPSAGPATVPLASVEVSNLIAVPVMAAQEGQRSEVHKDDAAAPGAIDEDPEGDGAFWFGAVQQLLANDLVSAMTRELALGAQLVARDQGHWMLRVERESLNQASSRERLKTALRELGHDVDLSVEVGAVRDSPARRNARAAALRHQAAESAILGDAFVQSMVRDFGAKIVPGSIQSN